VLYRHDVVRVPTFIPTLDPNSVIAEARQADAVGCALDTWGRHLNARIGIRPLGRVVASPG